MDTERDHLRTLLTLLLETLDEEDLAPGDEIVPGVSASRTAVRLQAEPERDVLSVPAFGYLTTLVRTGQITAAQMETLIQFAQRLAESPLAPGDLDPLLDHIVFAHRAGPLRWHAAEGGTRAH